MKKLIALATGFFPTVAFANFDTSKLGGFSGNSVNEFLTNNLIGWLVPLATTLAVLVIVVAGVVIISGAFSESAIASGKKAVGLALAGLVLVFSAYGITNFVGVDGVSGLLKGVNVTGYYTSSPSPSTQVAKDTLGIITKNILNFVAILAIAGFVWGGVRMIGGGMASAEAAAKGKMSLIASTLGLVVIALAKAFVATTSKITGTGLNSKQMLFGTDGAGGLVQNVISSVVEIVAVLAVLGLVVGGIEFITAAGSPERAKKGAATIRWSLIGMLVSMSAFAAVALVVGAPIGAEVNLLDKNVFAKIVGWLVGFVSIISLLMLTIGGWQMVTASGDAEKSGVGKKTVGYAVIGMVIVVFSYAIISAVSVFSFG